MKARLIRKTGRYEFHEDLVAFRPPAQQHKALIEIADFLKAELLLLVKIENHRWLCNLLISRPLERWSEGKMDNLIELGAIEVIPKFGVPQSGRTLIRLSMRMIRWKTISPSQLNIIGIGI